VDRTQTLAGVICAAALLSSCGPRPVVVGSKNFTEQMVLGEIVAQHLGNRLHVRVERSLGLGGTFVAQQALVAGSIDLYPEYTGTALTAVLKLPPERDAQRALRTVAAEYRRRFGAEWMPPLGFNNSFAMVVDGAAPERTLSDAARRPRGWRLAVGYEFVKRPDGLKGLLAAYGLRLEGGPRDMDLGLLYQALQHGAVDMAAGSATDGLIDALHLKVLEDDRHYFPPYEAALVVRGDTLARVPGLRGALAELSGRISTEQMRRLNYEVDGRHRRPAEAAREFLRSLYVDRTPTSSR
jgi:osmoprotectant transport system substrate-binding protein